MEAWDTLNTPVYGLTTGCGWQRNVGQECRQSRKSLVKDCTFEQCNYIDLTRIGHLTMELDKSL